jgi:hypothetical protein
MTTAVRRTAPPTAPPMMGAKGGPGSGGSAAAANVALAERENAAEALADGLCVRSVVALALGDARTALADTDGDTDAEAAADGEADTLGNTDGVAARDEPGDSEVLPDDEKVGVELAVGEPLLDELPVGLTDALADGETLAATKQKSGNCEVEVEPWQPAGGEPAGAAEQPSRVR